MHGPQVVGDHPPSRLAGVTRRLASRTGRPGRAQPRICRYPSPELFGYYCSVRGHEGRMRLRSIVLSLLTMTLGLSAGIPLAAAQAGRSMQIDDQPGVVPDPRDERLPAAFERQAVFYRSNEPPGTIVVDTSERYLYLIQGNNRAMR